MRSHRSNLCHHPLIGEAEWLVGQGKSPREAAAAAVSQASDPDAIAAMATEFIIRILADRDRARGVAAERQATRGRAMPARADVDRVATAIDQFRTATQTRWTQQLLATTFPRGDGTVVTWGEATVDDHEARRQMFAKNAVYNLEGAARHEQAIQDLRAADAETLGDLVAAVA